MSRTRCHEYKLLHFTQKKENKREAKKYGWKMEFHYNKTSLQSNAIEEKQLKLIKYIKQCENMEIDLSQW